MRLRMSWVVLALFVPALASADDHNADTYNGASGGGCCSNVYGVHQSFAISPMKWKPLGFVLADFSVQFGDEVTQVIYMAGARYTLALAGARNPTMHANKVLLQALFGTVRTNDPATNLTDNDRAFGLGVGYEWVKRIKGKDVAFRGIYDRINRSGDRDDWFGRLSGGVSYRFGSTQ